MTADIDDAKAVALGIGENHKIGIGFIPVPVDALGTESDQALHLGGLIGGVAGVQVRVYPGMILDRRFAPGQGQSRAGPGLALAPPNRPPPRTSARSPGPGTRN